MATADTGRTAAISGTQEYDSPRASHTGPVASLPLRFVWSPDGRECRCAGFKTERVSGDRRFTKPFTPRRSGPAALQDFNAVNVRVGLGCVETPALAADVETF